MLNAFVVMNGACTMVSFVLWRWFAVRGEVQGSRTTQ